MVTSAIIHANGSATRPRSLRNYSMIANGREENRRRTAPTPIATTATQHSRAKEAKKKENVDTDVAANITGILARVGTWWRSLRLVFQAGRVVSEDTP